MKQPLMTLMLSQPHISIFVIPSGIINSSRAGILLIETVFHHEPCPVIPDMTVFRPKLPIVYIHKTETKGYTAHKEWYIPLFLLTELLRGIWLCNSPHFRLKPFVFYNRCLLLSINSKN